MIIVNNKNTVKQNPIGLNAPLGIGEVPSISMVHTIEDNIKAKLIVLINTEVGERPGTNFGVELRRLLFDPDDDILMASVRDELTNKIARYIPEAGAVKIDILANNGVTSITIGIMPSDKLITVNKEITLP